MAKSPRLATAFLAISLFAGYVKYYLSFKNGFIGILSSMMAQDSLPGLPGHLCSEYTGFKFLDKFLTASNVYFWPIFQKQQEAPILWLYGMEFAGAMLPLWHMIVFEIHRRKPVSEASMEIILLISPLMICFGPGVAIPIIIARLALSKPESKRCDQSSPGSFMWAFSLGYVLPFVLAELPAPGVISYSTKQYLIVLWQIWPLTTSLIMYLSSLVAPPFPYDKETKQASFFAFICHAIGHITLLISFLVMKRKYKDTTTEKLLFPNFSDEGFFFNCFPFGFKLATKDLPFESGVLWSVQWDYFLSGLAGLIWMGELSSKTEKLYRPRGNSMICRFFCIVPPSTIVQMIWLPFIAGPCCAVGLMYRIASHIMSDSSPHVMTQSGHFLWPDRETGIASNSDKQK